MDACASAAPARADAPAPAPAAAAAAASAQATFAPAPAPPTGKRKRSAQGCVCDENDVLVEELKRVKSKVRDPTSHLAANYTRAISSIMHHSAPIRSGNEAKQLKNIGNYLGNQIQAILNKQRLRVASSGPNTAMLESLSDVQRLQQQYNQASAAAAVARQQAAAAATTTTTASIATGVVSETAPKDYAPAYKKQPWFVILALNDARATTEAQAVAIETLLTKLQSAGYDGNLVKLRACIASLCGTHEVVRKTASGLLYLTAKGQRSVQLCPGSLPRAAAQQVHEQQPSSEPLEAAPVSRQAQEPLQPGHRQSFSSTSSSVPPGPEPMSRGPSTAYVPPSTASTAPRTSTATETSVVCIDVSDSDDQDDDEEDAGSYDYEPDAEPLLFVEPPEPRERSPLSDSSSAALPLPPPRPLTPAPALQSTSDDAALMLPTDEWELVLLLDHREILSRQNRDVLERKLLEQRVTCEVRALNVGDMQWIAKRYRNGSVSEFVLNAIVERKEVRDLSGSIIDRRYTEQKTRLRASGLTHVVYLVEGSFTTQTTVRASGLETALCRTQVQDQFFVQVSQNADETVAFLAAMHARLLAKVPRAQCRNPERRARSAWLLPDADAAAFAALFCRPAQTFATFNALFRKKSSFTVGELYAMMLTQVPGFSAARAAGVAAAYPTFRKLHAALLAPQDAPARQKHKTRDTRLESVRCGEHQRRLSAKARACLSYLVTSTEYQDVPEPPATAGDA